MKICCSQEHYDKVVQYAKSINDKTLENCLERLKQWEKNENHPCEIELYYDHAPYSFGFCERYPDGNTGIVGGSQVPLSPEKPGILAKKPADYESAALPTELFQHIFVTDSIG